VSFVVFTIIARFLGPEEYGLVSLCYIYLAIAYALFSSIVDGVINLHIRDDLRLSSLFWGITAGSIILSILCFASATPFAMLMGQPRLASLLRWFSFLPFLLALSSVPTALVTHSMNFRIFTIRTLVATIISGIVGIIMAVKGFGAYAIVAQQTVLYVVTNIIIWPGSGWHPRFMFSFKELLDILKPGMKMSGSVFINFFEQQIPCLLIGHFLGAQAVGCFSFALRIRQSLQEVLIYPLSIVSYPALTRLMHNIPEQKRILSMLIMITGALALPCVIWAIITAPIYVPLFFGAKWIPAISTLQIYLFTVVCLPFTTILRDCLRAYNRMGSYIKMQSLLTACSLLVMLALAPYGLAHMMLGLAAFSLLSIPIYIYLVGERLKITLWQEHMRLWGSIAAAMIMAASVYAFDRNVYHPERLWVHLLEDTIIACVFYAAAYSALQFRQITLLIKFLKELMARRMDESQEATLIEETVRPV
jgi:O-antigen/teichoic acid export membrane protein